MANFLTTNGIKWTFDKELTLTGASNTYQYGQYCNDSYWVVGPATIIEISPGWNGSYNGAEINTIPDSNQGLTAAPGSEYAGSYITSRNVAIDIPRTIQPESSLLTSRGPGQCTNGVERADRTHISYTALLTVVTSPPPAGSFRPGYCGVNKIIMGNESDLRYDRLARTAVISGSPALSTSVGYFKNPWPVHAVGWNSYPAINPCGQGIAGYGANNAGILGEACLLANCNYTAAEKRELVISLVQLGIDVYSAVTNQTASMWLYVPDGGHGQFFKLAVMFAGVVLDNAAMISIGERSGDYLDTEPGYGPGNPPPDYIHFDSDSQSFYITATDVARGIGYVTGDIGLPEFGIRHSTYPSNYSNVNLWTTPYRQCCTAAGRGAGILAMHMMTAQGINVKALWNHNAMFDYMDRYLSIETSYQRFFRHPNSGWVSNMWDTYRNAYPPVWPSTAPVDTTPPSAPSNLVSSQQSDTTINLSWTAAGQAADGDWPIGYRIYRDSVFVSAITGTVYIDSGLTADTEYDYDIYAYDDAGNSSVASASNTFSTEEAPAAVTTIFINGNGSSANAGASWNDALRFLPTVLVRGATYYIGAGNFGAYTFNDAKNSTKITVRKATLDDHGSELGWSPSYAGQAQWGQVSFEATSYIDFLGGSTTQTLIQHSGPSPLMQVVHIIDSDHIVLNYSDVDGMNGGIGNLACSVLVYNNSSYVYIEHNDLHNCGDDLINGWVGDHIYFRWNRVYNAYELACLTGNGHSDAFEISDTDDSEFIGNFVYGCPNTSLFFTDNWSGTTCDRLLIANNIFYNNKNVWYEAYFSNTTYLRLYNNIFWGGHDGVPVGIAIEAVNTNMDIRNNIMGGITTREGGSWDETNIGDYNIIYQNPIGYVPGVNDLIGVDPKFTNAPTLGTPLEFPTVADFAPLDETAPSVDSGVAIAEVSFDIQHNSRPNGVGYDIGAFEYTGSVSTTGACCNPATGECSITTEGQCAFDWLGAGSNCGDCKTPIPVEGLLVSYTCSELSGYEAADAAGFTKYVGNIALGKPATQSSIYDVNRQPSNAVDGNTNGDAGNITHTEFDTNAWWEVDLGEVFNLVDINIWNRTDQYKTRLNNFYVFVSEIPFASTSLAVTLADSDIWNYYISDYPTPNILFPVNVRGRYIRIQLSGTGILSLAEVQVFARTVQSEGIPGSLINTANGYDNGTTEFTADEIDHTGEVYMDNMYDGLQFSTEYLQYSRGTIAAAIFPDSITGLPADRPAGESENRFIIGHSVGTWSNRIQLWIADGFLQLGMGDTHSLATDIVAVDVDTWYHVILTWIDSGITIVDGIVMGTPTGSGTWILYLDGIAVGSGSYSGLSQLDSIVCFGNTGKNIIPHNAEGFDGYMDNLKVYDIPLTASDSADLAYTDKKEIIPTPPTIDPPVITNVDATSITALQAIVGGEITDTGGEIPVVTLYYGESDGGEVAGSWDNSLVIGAVLTSFIIPIGGLTHNTTYFFRCYAENVGGSDWADASATFDTLEIVAPSLTQDAASNIGITTVTLSGDITDDGNGNPVILLYYGETDEGEVAANWDDFVSVEIASNDSFTIDITGLVADTTHFFRFAATNSLGTTWGSATLTFDTDPTGAPTIINAQATEISGIEAIIGGEVTDAGDENPTVTLYWGTSDGGVAVAGWDNTASFGVQTGAFEVLLTELSLATVYYYRAYATNSYGNDWANSTQSFSTLAIQPISPDPNDKTDGFLWGTYDNAYEIESPYVGEDIFDIHKVSRADVTFIAHKNYHPRKLTRLADKDWTLEEIDFVGGPFLRMNNDEEKTIQYVNGTGESTGYYYDVDNTGTLDAVGDEPFLEEMVGSLYLIQHTRQDNTQATADNHNNTQPTGDGVRCKGDWQLDVSNMLNDDDPNHTVKMWRRAAPGEWQEFKHFSAATLASGTEAEEDVFYTWTDSHEDVEGVFTAEAQLNKGIVKITSFISTTQVSCIIKKAVYQEEDTSDATSMYAEGAWNDYRGFPKAVTFYGNRLWWAGTTYNPQGVWGSKVGLYEDHTGGVADDDAVSISISGNDVSSIEWITASQSFMIGSAKKEYIASASDKRDPITPKDMVVKPHSTNGSKHIQPVEIGGGMLYAQRIGYKMLILSYKYLDDAYDSADANRLAPHMFRYPAVDISKQGTPETVVWVTREDGTLCPYRFDKEEEISAWSRIVTGSAEDSPTHAFISTAVIAGSSEDRVWTMVERIVGGKPRYYVERFAYRNYIALSDALFLDSARSVTTNSVGTLSRLFYLEGHTVTVMKDTEQIGSYQIIGGDITGLEANTDYVIGLPYMCRMRTMAFAIPGAITEGNIKRCLSVMLRTVRTRGGQAGCESHGQANMVDLDIPYSVMAADVEAFGEGGYTKEGRVVLDFSDPYPATVLAIVFEMEIIP